MSDSDTRDVDRAIEEFYGAGSSWCELGEPLERLGLMGEPALRRLLEVIEGSVRLPNLRLSFREFHEKSVTALKELGRDHLDAFIDSLRNNDRQRRSNTIMYAFRTFWEDRRVRDLLNEDPPE